MKIGVFDSGIGGLTVLKEIINKYPKNEYVYFGDTANLPYGSKNREELEKLVDNIVDFFKREKVDVIIAACGTVSTSLNKKLKKLGIIDVVTPTIDYVNTNFHKVGIIATETTINSNYFQKHINGELQTLATPLLVPMIESADINQKVIDDYMQKFLDIEVLILGCTHYPLIEEYIRFKTINMGKILASTLKISNNSKYSLKVYFSKINDTLIKNVKAIIDEEIEVYDARITRS